MADTNETPEIDNLYISFTDGFVILGNNVTLPIDSCYNEEGDEVSYETCRYVVAGRDNYWLRIDLDEYRYKPCH